MYRSLIYDVIVLIYCVHTTYCASVCNPRIIHVCTLCTCFDTVCVDQVCAGVCGAASHAGSPPAAGRPPSEACRRHCTRLSAPAGRRPAGQHGPRAGAGRPAAGRGAGRAGPTAGYAAGQLPAGPGQLRHPAAAGRGGRRSAGVRLGGREVLAG